ncbi:heparinase II/III domain-containing protein [Cohnella silvisoli]|uniref:Heparinase II/III family protein n=1 Tax=Cohnella silvisoli TaxID=2873699 RepID=A0ABV1L1S3_9BACL|nr:heparinase II/III family protein [Cohnella silvisoli]MCD9025936.1 heparinase II/III-family protein [Cohnella silvisoli]
MMLYERYGKERLENVILDSERFVPIPKADNREAWGALLPESKQMWVTLAEQYADYEWPAIRTSDYMEYWRTGEIGRHSNAIFERRSVLGIMVIAECFKDEGRFLDQIINGIFVICEETSWVTPSHRLHWKVNMDECLPDASDHRVELFTAETSKLLIWARYLLQSRFDGISVRIGERIVREVQDRLLKPYMERDDYWWLGFMEGVRVNNWNPWCNGAVLTGFLLLENDPAARAEGIAKAMRSLDAFIRTYPPDGCCDEGPSYWSPSGGGLYECLELLQLASQGKIDLFGETIVRDIGSYLYKVHIHDSYFAAFADCDAKADPGGDVVYRYGRSTKDNPMIQLGASRPKSGKPRIHIWFGMYGHLRDLFLEKERLASRMKAPYIQDAWLAHTQVMTAREREGSELGLYVAAKGGNNQESHNHNDIGNFLVFADGYPLLVDLGTEEYSAKTFGDRRYELWYLQSQYHNLPTVRGVLQQNGSHFRAASEQYRQSDVVSELSLDIASAYPLEAGIASWRRAIRLTRGRNASVEIIDNFSMKGTPADIFYSLMTPCTPVIAEPGIIRLEYASGKEAVIHFDAEHLDVRCETIDFMESRLKRNWGELMYRIVLFEKTPVLRGIRTLSITIAQ